MDRGVIITPPHASKPNSLEFGSATYANPLSIRQYLLYWDKIDHPTNNILGYPIHPDLNYLIKIGVAQSTRINFGMVNDIGSLIPTMQSRAYNINRKDTSITWEIAQSNSAYNPPKELASRKATLELKLLKTIPVPIDSTHLDDILKFKNKRKPELISFREHLDDLTKRIIENQHEVNAEKVAVERIENDLRALKRTLTESKIKSVKRSMSAILETPINKTANEIAGWVGDLSPIPYSSLAIKAFGVTAGAIQAIPKIMSFDDRLPADLKPYAYLAYAQRDL